MRAFWLILLAAFMGSLAQLLLKLGSSRLGPSTTSINLVILWKIATNGPILLGLGLYALASVVWIVVLTRAELSFAYPMLALTYVLVTVGSWAFFREPVIGLRVIGMVLVVIGVILIGRT
ncbi:MAG: cation/cationic drug transporter [Armatimonadota bacterium]|nr:cation/cationic drug transporter [Armatimonadota bacterium]MDR5703127.1 cation/cationic drug transporter [Armatimonadota bacterium]MDR7435579.1 cation/cationic drug transporter [Armatimonadota bacterium]